MTQRASFVDVDPTRFKTVPFAHQIDGVRLMTRRRCVALFDEMGAAKTKQVIDAACSLFEAGEIDTVIVECPAQVKDVWLDEDLGEITKHCWSYAAVIEYNARNAAFEIEPTREEDGKTIRQLTFVVASYEFLRQEDARGDFPRVDALVKKLTRKGDARRVLLACDESSALNNHKSLQTRATYVLRKFCERCVVMNGSPNDPMHLYSQYAILDKSILGYQNFFHFRAVHAVMGGFNAKQVVGFKDLEKITTKTAPFTLRRLKEDCLDLPKKMPPSFISTPLSPKTWKLYVQMKTEMLAELERGTLLVQHAAVKALRLSQLTSGFLGGWFDEVTDEPEVEEISDEKTSAIVSWLETRFSEDQNFQGVIWCRFRPEIARLYERVAQRFKGLPVETLQGGQSKAQRKSAKDLLHPDSEYSGPALLIGQPQAGRFGLNMTKANYVVYLSQDYNLLTREQSEDRVHRPGQTRLTYFLDVIATGPDGQKTIDHHIRKVIDGKVNVARLTTEGWKRALREEL